MWAGTNRTRQGRRGPGSKGPPDAHAGLAAAPCGRQYVAARGSRATTHLQRRRLAAVFCRRRLREGVRCAHQRVRRQRPQLLWLQVAPHGGVVGGAAVYRGQEAGRAGRAVGGRRMRRQHTQQACRRRPLERCLHDSPRPLASRTERWCAGRWCRQHRQGPARCSACCSRCCPGAACCRTAWPATRWAAGGTAAPAPARRSRGLQTRRRRAATGCPRQSRRPAARRRHRLRPRRRSVHGCAARRPAAPGRPPRGRRQAAAAPSPAQTSWRRPRPALRAASPPGAVSPPAAPRSPPAPDPSTCGGTKGEGRGGQAAGGHKRRHRRNTARSPVAPPRPPTAAAPPRWRRLLGSAPPRSRASGATRQAGGAAQSPSSAALVGS